MRSSKSFGLYVFAKFFSIDPCSFLWLNCGPGPWPFPPRQPLRGLPKKLKTVLKGSCLQGRIFPRYHLDSSAKTEALIWWCVPKQPSSTVTGKTSQPRIFSLVPVWFDYSSFSSRVFTFSFQNDYTLFYQKTRLCQPRLLKFQRFPYFLFLIYSPFAAKYFTRKERLWIGVIPYWSRPS